MKTVLKVLLIVLGSLLVLKQLPIVFGLGIGLLAVLAVAAVVGLGAAGVLICIALGFVAVFSPLWLPVLALVGLVALWKKAASTA
jgi:hypothetical protein